MTVRHVPPHRRRIGAGMQDAAGKAGKTGAIRAEDNVPEQTWHVASIHETTAILKAHLDKNGLN